MIKFINSNEDLSRELITLKLIAELKYFDDDAAKKLLMIFRFDLINPCQIQCQSEACHKLQQCFMEISLGLKTQLQKKFINNF